MSRTPEKRLNVGDTKVILNKLKLYFNCHLHIRDIFFGNLSFPHSCLENYSIRLVFLSEYFKILT